MVPRFSARLLFGDAFSLLWFRDFFRAVIVWWRVFAVVSWFSTRLLFGGAFSLWWFRNFSRGYCLVVRFLRWFRGLSRGTE